jgi:DNA-binding response OmpR family regulator
MLDTPRRILVVDDEPELLSLFEEYLCLEGFEVLTSSTGREAIAIARAARPELILLDVMMPEVSGFDVCNILQDAPATAEIPILFLTALADAQQRIMNQNMRADNYMTKPFTLHDLTARVLAAMRPQAMPPEGDAK